MAVTNFSASTKVLAMGGTDSIVSKKPSEKSACFAVRCLSLDTVSVCHFLRIPFLE